MSNQKNCSYIYEDPGIKSSICSNHPYQLFIGLQISRFAYAKFYPIFALLGLREGSGCHHNVPKLLDQGSFCHVNLETNTGKFGFLQCKEINLQNSV